MAISGNDVRVLHAYAEGVMNRADHHADNVKGIALALLGGIIWRGNPESIKIKQYGGSLANVLWVEIGTKIYAFAYNYNTEEIEIRDRTQSGTMLHSFTNQTSPEKVEAIFRSL